MNKIAENSLKILAQRVHEQEKKLGRKLHPITYKLIAFHVCNIRKRFNLYQA